MATPEAKELAQKAAQANKDHQYALKVYTERLEAELEIVDRLLAMADVSDHEDDLELDAGGTVMVPSSIKAKSPINSNDLLSEISPFHDDATKRQQYVDWTTIHPMKSTELEVLADAVRSENYRLHALDAQRRGMPAFGGLNDFPPGYFELNKDGIDWERVAMKVSSSNSVTVQRSAQECKIRWLGERHPHFNHTQWTQSEIAKLRALTENAREGEVDWVDIATKLGTRRTPLDCMRHAITRRTHFWTPEADHKLMQAVKVYGSDNWSLVARMVSEDATPQQCQNRYLRTLDPSIKRGTWVDEEDEKLRQAVAVFGHSWSEVAAFVPGRTNEQCRDRYQEYLSPYSSRTRWTEEMEKLLLDAVDKIGYGRWREISEMVGHGRTDTMCRTRYNLLMKRKENMTVTPPAPPEPPGRGHIIDLTQTQPEVQGTSSTSEQSIQSSTQPITFVHAPTPPAPPREQPSTNLSSNPSVQKPKPKPRRKKATSIATNCDNESSPNPTATSEQTGESSATPNLAPQVQKPKPTPRRKKIAPLPADGGGVTPNLTEQTAGSEKRGPATPHPEAQTQRLRIQQGNTVATTSDGGDEFTPLPEQATSTGSAEQSAPPDAGGEESTAAAEPAQPKPRPRPRKTTKRSTPPQQLEEPTPKKRRTTKRSAASGSLSQDVPVVDTGPLEPEATTAPASGLLEPLSTPSQDGNPRVHPAEGPQGNPGLSTEAPPETAAETPATEPSPTTKPQRGSGRKVVPARGSAKNARIVTPKNGAQQDGQVAEDASHKAESREESGADVEVDPAPAADEGSGRRPRRAAAMRSGYSRTKS
ncbi:hypothetical protein OBBRIDRAFT_885384 [Obba rivulosa]|uniref:Uncharacterized protein n=1 Tax=Obba rivulosa TaxID=1052685 RepID=A0A8E2J300_9APHY|nr:hypothetical protein OBBRIDRAFT_885384 [Obba rivulosa]